MAIFTEKQKRSQQHNWLRLRLAGNKGSLVSICNSPTVTKDARDQAKGIIDLIEELDEMLRIRLDENGNVEHISNN